MSADTECEIIERLVTKDALWAFEVMLKGRGVLCSLRSSAQQVLVLCRNGHVYFAYTWLMYATPEGVVYRVTAQDRRLECRAVYERWASLADLFDLKFIEAVTWRTKYRKRKR